MYKESLEYIQEKLKGNADVLYRNITTSQGMITLIFINTITDKAFISEYIVTPLVKNEQNLSDINTLKNKVLFSSTVCEAASLDDAIFCILSGNVLLLFDFLDILLFCEAKKIVERPIERPQNEPIIKGSQEGFNEVLRDNINLLRKRIKSPSLKIEKLQLGSESRTTVIILYIEGKAPGDLIHLIRSKISNIKIDFAVDTNYLEEELKEKDTDFDTILYTEKPDVLVSKLFEGRVAVMMDGCPTAISAPSFFVEYFQSPDDYYLNKSITNSVKILRILSFIITVSLPGIYLALFTHHFSLVPPDFIFRIATARSGVPFPTVIEVLIILFFFELSREAGRRLPANIGQSLSIVSALILGQAAIGAGFASESTVVIMGVYAITSYINPRLATVTPKWSILCIILSATFGFHGVYIFFILLNSHISSLTSCGYPYLFPMGTATQYNFKSKDYALRGWLGGISRKIFRRGEG